MAKDSVEVEIKIPVNKRIFEETRKRVKSDFKFVSVSHDVDVYFNAPHRDFLAGSRTEEFLRLRTKNNGNYFTYKRGYWNNKNEHTHSDEYETKIDNLLMLKKILSVLNFKEILSIDKVRETYKLKEEFELCFNKVKHLGCFIEIESLKDFGDKEKTMEKIYDFARKIGLDPEKRDSKGYVTLMMEKKKLFGR